MTAAAVQQRITLRQGVHALDDQRKFIIKSLFICFGLEIDATAWFRQLIW